MDESEERIANAQTPTHEVSDDQSKPELPQQQQKLKSENARKALKLLVVVSAVAGLLILGKLVLFSETDYQKKTKRYQQNLSDILRGPDKQKQLEELKDLAREVGAGSEHNVIGAPFRLDEHTVTIPQSSISPSELAQNINNALQTRSSISAVEESTKSNWIVFGALVVSSIALVVAYSAYQKSLRIEREKLFMERSPPA